MGQSAHPAPARTQRRAGVGLAAAALVAATTVAGCGTPLSAATTTLEGVVDTHVLRSDGSTVPAIDGMRLHRGDVVRTGPAGRAELRTRGRIVYEGSDASLQVLDGARSDLRHGAVVVDAQHGPGLALTVAGLRVSAAGGSAVRAERAVTTRIATLAGSAGIDSSTGRHLDVPALTQAVVGGDALPDSTADSPLRLTDDDGEAHAVPALVRDDLALISLAAGVDTTGSGTARAVTAAWRSTLEPLPSGVARSEQVLPLVIAATSKSDAPTRYRDALALRRDGASWGVVATRLGTNAAAVAAALQAFEGGASAGQIGSVPEALSLLTQGGVGAGSPRSSGGRGGSSNGSGSGSGSSQGGPHPAPSPSPSSSPVTVGGTIDKVLHLLPTPVPTPTLSVPSLPLVGSAIPSPVPLLPH